MLLILLILGVERFSWLSSRPALAFRTFRFVDALNPCDILAPCDTLAPCDAADASAAAATTEVLTTSAATVPLLFAAGLLPTEDVAGLRRLCFCGSVAAAASPPLAVVLGL